jgi:hypothetical protein
MALSQNVRGCFEENRDEKSALAEYSVVVRCSDSAVFGHCLVSVI